MPEVMSIAVTADDQWLVVNGRPVEYYASDTAFVEGRKVWASEQAALRLSEALACKPDIVDFVSARFPDAVVTVEDGERELVEGAAFLQQLGLEATDPTEIPEEDLIIFARELVSRARSHAGASRAPVAANSSS